MITSLYNQKIKNLIAARKPATRRTQQRVIIEGTRECQCAFAASLPIREVYYCTPYLDAPAQAVLNEAQQLDAVCYEVAESVFDKISFGNRKEGIVFVAEEPAHALETISLQTTSLVIVIDAVEKPGNVGAILRTANATGVDAVLITNSGIDLYNQNAIRASLGALFLTPTVQCTPEKAYAWLRKNNVQIITAHPDASASYLSSDATRSTAYVVGREDTGVSSFWLSHADACVHIPMTGIINSLNVSVSTGILLYEVMRQRKQK